MCFFFLQIFSYGMIEIGFVDRFVEFEPQLADFHRGSSGHRQFFAAFPLQRRVFEGVQSVVPFSRSPEPFVDDFVWQPG